MEFSRALMVKSDKLLDENTKPLNLKLKLIEDQFNLNYYFPFNFSSVDSLMEERENRFDIKKELELKENLTTKPVPESVYAYFASNEDSLLFMLSASSGRSG